MKLSIQIGLLAALGFTVSVVGCGDDETTPPPTTTTSSGGSGGSGGDGSGGDGGSGDEFPEPPTIGSQVDRMGRPAINTALNLAFADENNNGSTDTARGQAEDAYNADDDPSSWGSDYVAMFRANIAVLDGVDETCGNSVGFDALGNPDYATLATVLANDWLVVRGDGTQCENYLGVETDALGITTDGDCGGRRPSDDVVDASYSALSGAAGFGDGVSTSAAAMETAFPYLAAPNN